MRVLFITVIAMLAASVVMLQAETPQTIEEYSGYQWERLMLREKVDIVGGVLAGINMTKDFVLDLDTDVYEHYLAFNKFLMRHNITAKIIETLDKYYELNRENYKYNDRCTLMIMAIYGKYWWNCTSSK
jgi:hypothetical protein